MTKKRLGLIGALLVGVALFVLVLFFTHGPTKDKIVTISGVSGCSKGIDGAIIDNLGTVLYGFVEQANNFNKASTQPTYKGEVRDGSCSQGETQTETADTGEKLTVKKSSAIVDIPDAKQSWKISYAWVGRGDALKLDLGTLTPSCLANDQLKYGDFSCQKVLNIQKYGVPDYDPILEYMPYSGVGFNLEYNSPAKQVIATILIPRDKKDNQAFIDNNKAEVPSWFQDRGLDISKYTVIYRVLYQ